MTFKPEAVSLYAAIITGIITVTYPILLQVITGFQKTYNSLSIVKLFKSTKEYCYFQPNIIIAISMVIIWTLNFEPPNFNLLGVSLENSADIFVLTSTVLLLFNFFLLFSRIYQFYSPEKLIEFVRDYKDEKENQTIFLVTRDLLFYSLERGVQRRDFEKSIPTILKKIDRYYLDFKIKEANKKEVVVFPDQLYSFSFDLNEYFSKNGIESSRGILPYTKPYSWLISGNNKTIISEQTYQVLWHNFIIALKNDSDELIKGHWQTAVGHYTLNMKSKESISDDQNETETDIYLRFHYLMCACLFYVEKYDLLKDLINYTNSSFEESPLLPKDLNGIFNLINYYGGHTIFNYEWISRYYFPGMDGIRATDEKIQWVLKFQALLFTRKYNEEKKKHKRKELDLRIPEYKHEIKDLSQNITAIKRQLPNISKDEELMSEFNFKDFDYECKLDEFISQLNAEFESSLKTEKLDGSKVGLFTKSTEKIICSITEQLKGYRLKSKDEKYNKNLYSNLSEVQVYNRDAFTVKPLTPHLDFEKTLGIIIKNKIQTALAQVLLKHTIRAYLIENGKIKKAVNKLGPLDDLCYWRFNAAFEDFDLSEMLSAEFKTEWHQSTGKSLFVFKKSKKPFIEFIKPENPSPEDLGLNKKDKINDALNLYAGVKEFDEVTQEVQNWFDNKTDKEKNKSVLGIALLTMKFMLHDEFEVVRILEYSEYRNQGIPDDPDSIEKLK